MILFEDEKKSKKLEEAIKYGFIVRKIDPDGIVRYILTDKGFFQYSTENKKFVFR